MKNSNKWDEHEELAVGGGERCFISPHGVSDAHCRILLNVELPNRHRTEKRPVTSKTFHPEVSDTLSPETGSAAYLVTQSTL